MSKLILAIEDDKDISQLYENIFTEAGYQVRLMRFKPVDVQFIGQIQPDLIISDWGLEQQALNWNFIRIMQNTPTTTNIPILICTALSLKANKLGERLQECKIKMLEKPFDIDELLVLVETSIAEQETPPPGCDRFQVTHLKAEEKWRIQLV